MSLGGIFEMCLGFKSCVYFSGFSDCLKEDSQRTTFSPQNQLCEFDGFYFLEYHPCLIQQLLIFSTHAYKILSQIKSVAGILYECGEVIAWPQEAPSLRAHLLYSHGFPLNCASRAGAIEPNVACELELRENNLKLSQLWTNHGGHKSSSNFLNKPAQCHKSSFFRWGKDVKMLNSTRPW